MIKKVINNTIALHLVFWILSYGILLNILSIDESFFTIDYIFTGMFVFSLAVPVYVNRFLLIPLLLYKSKYFVYSTAFIALIFLGALFNELLFNNIVDFIFPNYYIISSYEYEELLLVFLVFLVSTTLLKLSKERLNQLEMKSQLARLKEEKMRIELKSLKDHINPHFLFNNLNTVYSLIEKDSKKAEEAIIQLSDILRFMIYQVKQDHVKITEEVKLIENYLNLQRNRIDGDVKIIFDYDIQVDTFIAPLLMMPLVENCFKHGITTQNKNPRIEIRLFSDERKIHFSALNSLNKSKPNDKRTGGSGLKNIKERLEYIYPQKHDFVYTLNENTFHAKIIIDNEL